MKLISTIYELVEHKINELEYSLKKQKEKEQPLKRPKKKIVCAFRGLLHWIKLN
jgi:hypothetical protein